MSLLPPGVSLEFGGGHDSAVTVIEGIPQALSHMLASSSREKRPRHTPSQ